MAALLLLPAGIAFVVASLRPDTYAARAEFLLDDGTGSGTVEQQTATLLSLLSTRSVLAPIAEGHGITVEELENSIEIEQLEAGNVVRITVADEDPDVARAIAEDLVDSYSDLVAGLRGGTAELNLLNERLADLVARQGVIRTELQQLASSSAQADVERARQLQLESDLLQQQISELQGRAVDLEAEVLAARDAIKLIGSPYVLDAPVAPQPVRAAAIGLLIGIVLTVGTALVVGRSHTTRT
ncbi:hypothetical protein ACI799_12425 [Blastococcus sp. SYSU DS0753]